LSENNSSFTTELSVFNEEIGINDEDLWKTIEQKLKSPTWEYKVKKGETLWEISKKFKVSIEDLMLLNNLSSEKDLKFGQKIKIPGKPPAPQIAQRSQTPSLPSSLFKGKYVSALSSLGNLVVPVSGYNWGERHGQNATDIAAPCGEPVYAAQSGYVVISRDGWNSGYGNYVVIYHQNFSTLYAHLSLRTVSEGEYVEQGDLIGYVGNTGYVKGLTGCHLHFEVRGLANPLLR